MNAGSYSLSQKKDRHYENGEFVKLNTSERSAVNMCVTGHTDLPKAEWFIVDDEEERVIAVCSLKFAESFSVY